MNKKIPISVAITVAIIAMTVTFSITMIVAMEIFDKTVTSVKEKEIMYTKVSEIDKVARANFSGEIDDLLLYDMLGAGYIAGLGDKDSKYYTAEKIEEALNKQSGKLMGIGVETVKDSTGYARIVKVYDNSPAQTIGMTVGNYITSIETEQGKTDVKLISNTALATLLQGEAGTQIVVTYSDIEGKEIETTIQRSNFAVQSVEYEVLEGNIGYVKIVSFDDTTTSSLDAALNDLKQRGMVSYIFDVRYNSSNSMEAAASCANLICPEGIVANNIVKDGVSEVFYESTNDNVLEVPSVVLMNETTQGAGELFASAVKDLSGAKLVGVRTAGKASIQSLFRLSDGSGIDITVGTLVPASGESYAGVGLNPDYEVTVEDELKENRYSIPAAQDPQVIRAVEIAQGVSGTQSDSSTADTSGTVEPNSGDATILPDDTAQPESEAAPEEEETQGITVHLVAKTEGNSTVLEVRGEDDELVKDYTFTLVVTDSKGNETDYKITGKDGYYSTDKLAKGEYTLSLRTISGFHDPDPTPFTIE